MKKNHESEYILAGKVVTENHSECWYKHTYEIPIMSKQEAPNRDYSGQGCRDERWLHYFTRMFHIVEKKPNWFERLFKVRIIKDY